MNGADIEVDRGYRVKKQDMQQNQSTYYIRDASGNLLSIYEHDESQAGTSPEPVEVLIYGSSRLGFFRPDPIALNEHLVYYDDDQVKSSYETKSYVLVEGASMTLTEGFEVSYQNAREEEFSISFHEPNTL
ncbi:hypothetical protein [Tunicatimonas pelagia]|uniref:hypothetical protein n=1 Tax=Tunicatimonas pelagia TaxID=931531 RepID=UPI002666A818|nr:hypothetical protein [Tunicatimonas pelagia]WKN45291.1 hypothetical protein P0M28_10005 [Tunicatimonas pelagia]